MNKWLNKGDRSTFFYQGMASARRRFNWIKSVEMIMVENWRTKRRVKENLNMLVFADIGEE